MLRRIESVGSSTAGEQKKTKDIQAIKLVGPKMASRDLKQYPKKILFGLRK